MHVLCTSAIMRIFSLEFCFAFPAASTVPRNLNQYYRAVMNITETRIESFAFRGLCPREPLVTDPGDTFVGWSYYCTASRRESGVVFPDRGDVCSPSCSSRIFHWVRDLRFPPRNRHIPPSKSDNNRADNNQHQGIILFIFIVSYQALHNNNQDVQTR